MPYDDAPSPDQRNRALFSAALRGDTAAMEQLLRHGADASTRQARTDFGQLVPALYAAADAGQAEAVRLLLKHGAKPDAGTPEGRTPLMAAVLRGDVATAQTLVDAGAKPTARYGQESLFDMAERLDAPHQMMRALLSKLPPERLQEAFMEAARRGQSALAEAALDMGVDIEARDNTGNTPLILAAQNTARPRHAARIARALIARGAAVDAENDLQETALSAAMTRQPLPAETVRVLVEAGADIMRNNLAGVTNYAAAGMAGNEHILPLFEAARKQQILRDVKKYYEGTGNKVAIRAKPLKPRQPPK